MHSSPSLPQQSSQNFRIFRVAKNYRSPCLRPALLAPRGDMSPAHYPLLLVASTSTSTQSKSTNVSASTSNIDDKTDTKHTKSILFLYEN